MASDKSFVEYVVEQIENAGFITYRKMFGEYAVYAGGKLVGLICDNQLFIKPTEGGRAWIGDVVEAPPYPGAKNSFLIEDLEDRDWISELIRVTAAELPPRRTSSAQTKNQEKVRGPIKVPTFPSI
jgi:TfoX/Sxy family transcriptional regulator of competence genes